jgi:hypothetical protein
VKLLSIKGATVLLITDPRDPHVAVGDFLALWDMPLRLEGVVCQAVSLEPLDYPGQMEEVVQEALTESLAGTVVEMDRECGMAALRAFKLLRAKIHRKINVTGWTRWDGWVPGRDVMIEVISPDDVIQAALGSPKCPLETVAHYKNQALPLDGSRMGMVGVMAGIKGSGKSHLAKRLVLAVAKAGVPVVVFDPNGEYTQLPGAQVIRWGDYRLRLSETGYGVLVSVVQSVVPLQTGSPSAGAFETTLPMLWRTRRDYCERSRMPFSIDIDWLLAQSWATNQFVSDAIRDRLMRVRDMRLFETEVAAAPESSEVADLYEAACNGRPLVCDMRTLSTGLRSALVRAIIRIMEAVCHREFDSGSARYPILVLDEASLYVSETMIVDLITRTRHVGVASWYVTNDPQRLPGQVFRQADNIVLFQLNDRMDCRVVSGSYIDQESAEALVTRMPARSAVLVGELTGHLPIVASIDPMPPDVVATGQTRSAWRRFTAINTV